MAILFDFNGTMFFDDVFQERSWRKFIEESTHRYITEDEFYNHLYGRNAGVIMKYCTGRTGSKSEIEIWEEEKEKRYRQLCFGNPEFQLAPGLIEFLDFLKRNGVPMNIATASNGENVKFFFDNLHLDQWFDVDQVVYNDSGCKGKPEPDMYLLAAERIGVSINDCYIFEDSRSGIEAARRANARAVIKVASMKRFTIDIATDLEIKTYYDIRFEDFV